MKKVTILSYTVDVGGIEKYVSSLCKMLEDDFSVKIICTYKVGEKPAFFFSNKVKIEYLINERKDAVSLKLLWNKKKIFAMIKEIIRRVKINRQEKYRNIKAIKSLDCDYLITTRIFYDKLVHRYLKNKKIITIATDHNDHNNNKKYIRTLLKSVASFDYFIICTKKLFNDYKPHLPNTECVYIPNFLGNISSEKSNLKKKNLISVGRFSPEKGFVDLVEVMSIVHKLDSDIKLFLLGDGFQKQEIVDAIKKHHLEEVIEMPGYVSLAQQKSYYLKSSLYVLPSHLECFGLVLLESMSYGVPAIAFDSATGAKELLKDDIGIIVKNRDTEKMAKEIVKLVNDKKRLNNYQKKINSYILNYSMENAKKKWIDILK